MVNNPMPARTATWLLAILLQFACTGVHAQEPFRCAIGAWVDLAKRCDNFAYFRSPDDDETDPRILKAAGGTDAVRTIGILVGISDYPNFARGALPAAHSDVGRLKNFLIDHQHFDEVVILENADATAEAIRYFLTQYVPLQGQAYNKRLRVLFAFSGHGIADDMTPSLVLSSAASATDISGLYPLHDLQSNLQGIAAQSWQVLGLVDACYGGGIFGIGWAGGNPDAYWKEGAYVVTAGSKGSLTWAMADGGSMFFNAFVDGMVENRANAYPVFDRDPKDPTKRIDRGHVITQGQAVAEATRAIHDMQTGVVDVADIDKDLISEPWVGSIEPTHPSAGAFFFLADKPLQVVTSVVVVSSSGPTVSKTISLLPIGEVVMVTSTVRGGAMTASGPARHHEPPARKSAKPKPQTEPAIRGVDVSHHSGKIEWPKVKASGISFAYVKAVQGASYVDPELSANLNALHAAGIPYGVYASYDFCADPEEQFDNLSRAVPSGDDVLPLALDAEFLGAKSNEQKLCATKNVGATRAKMRRFLELVSELYKKPPIIYSNKEMSPILDKGFEAYPVWVADYNKRAAPAAKRWTIWQYAGTGAVDGIKGQVDMNLFAGSPAEFEAFKAGSLR